MVRFLISLLLSVSITTYGQNIQLSKIDSLTNVLKHAQSDTMRVNILLHLANAFVNLNADESLKFGEKALNIAQTLNNENDIASSQEIIGRAYWKKRKFKVAIEKHLSSGLLFQKLNNNHKTADLFIYLGQDYGDLGDATNAEKYFTLALKAYREIGNKSGEARAHTLLGWLFEKTGKYQKSAANNYEAYKRYEEIGDRQGLAIANMDIGDYHENMNDYATALQCYFLGAKEFESQNDTIRLSNAYNDIGRAYRKMGKPDDALKYHDLALALGHKINNDNNIGSALVHIGDVKMSIGYYSEALNDYRNAEKSFLNSVNKWELASLYAKIGVCYSKLGKYEFSRNMLDTAMLLSTELKSTTRVAACLYGLTVLDSATGKWKDAYDHAQLLARYNDSIFNGESSRKLVQLQMQHEFDRQLDQKNRQIELNNLRIGQKRTTNILLIGGIIVLAVVIIFLVKEKRKSDVLGENLRLSLSQKEVLMKEIHHRVKNNLQVISSLLRLQAGTVSDETAKEALTESQNRVLSIALIHQKLYQDEKMDMVEFGAFADELFEQVKRVFGKTVIPVKFVNNVKERHFAIDIAVPLGLILNELITNSFKYAFGNNMAPTIELNIDNDNDHYRLQYFDNGPGLLNNTNFEKSQTLGMRLIIRLSKQLNGNAEYHYQNGSYFLVNFTI